MSFADEMRSELAKALKAHVETAIPDEQLPDVHSFEPAPEVRDLVAVDGSYNFLLNISSWWLALVSVALLRYRFDGGAYHREDWRLVQRAVGVSTWAEYVKSQDERLRALYEFTRNSAEPHREMVNELRRFIEGEVAANYAGDSDGLIVAVDGALQEFPKRFEVMEHLVKACERRGHLLVGVSKDSQLHAFGQTLTDEDFLKRCESRAGGTGPAYVKAPASVPVAQKGLLLGDVYYVRFHAHAPKWFRVDVGTHKDDPESVFTQVAPYCRSLISIGYPLPLLEAHRMAVTVRQLRGAYQEMIIRTATGMGMDIRAVLNGLTEMEGRKRGAFHEYLDRISRGLR
ncbi:MAG TPA: DNA double-strand break repair nuclease NurA [Thermoplasmata archaeon]|nr:DNA double-strand break repair nuclease NurA [Thermoplasmata archaeon]